GQQCVGGAVHVDGVGAERGRRPADREALHLVDENDCVRSPRRELRDRVHHQLADVALTFAEQLAGKRVRVDLHIRRCATRSHPTRCHLRQPAGKRRLAGPRRPRQDDQAVWQPGHGGQRRTVQQREQGVVEQPLLHTGRREDVVPRPVVMIGGQRVNGQHPGWHCRRRHGHVGLVTSGQSIVVMSPAWASLMCCGGSSNSTMVSINTRMVSSRLSNMWIRTTFAVFSGSSLKCWCQRKWSTTMMSPFFHGWFVPPSGSVPR